MRSRTVVFLMLLIPTMVMAGIYLAPSQKEVALMSMKDANFDEAMQYFTSLYSKGDNSVDVLVPLINLHTHYGNIDEAISLLQSFIDKHPHSVEALRRLAGLYKSSQRLHAYARTLEAWQKLTPSAAILRELADTYAFTGQYDKEMQALAQLVANKHYSPREEDFIRLASFYRIDQKPQEASRVLLALIESRKVDVHVDTVVMAAQFLMEQGQEPKAMALVSDYVKDKGKENVALMIAFWLQQQGKSETAYAMLLPFLSKAELSPSLLQLAASLQLSLGKTDEAYSLLWKKFEEKTLPDFLTAGLIELTIRYKDYGRTEAVMNAVSPQVFARMPEDVMLNYAGMIIELKRPDLARILQNKLSKEHIHNTPLLSAVLDVAVRDTPKTMEALLTLPANIITTPGQKLLLSSIFWQHGHYKQAFALYDSVPLSIRLESFDALQFAQLYLAVDASEKAKAQLADVRAQASPVARSQVDNALLLLAAGEGKNKDIEQWLKATPNPDPNLLSDALTLAQQYKHSALVLALVERAFQLHPTAENRAQLIYALLQNRRYAAAMEKLRPSIDKDAKARALYIEAMAEWIRQAGTGTLGQNYSALEASIAAALKRADMTVEEKRNVAYLLQETGFYDKAQGLFIELATDQPLSSQDVQELLGFWGQDLSPGALSWIENRAISASGDEKAAWLQHLNALGYSQHVLDLMRDQPHATTSARDEYIYALTALHKRAPLREVLVKEIETEDNAKRLAQLSTTAMYEDLHDVSEKGWRKVHQIDPGNAPAIRALGLAAFNTNRYSEAEQWLAKYLSENKGDYQVNFAYAEILQHKQKKSKATPYFQRAQQQVSEISEKSVSVLLDEARLLYRTNRLQEAVDLYRKLLAQHPQDKNIRADFAELLIETKQYDAASQVLSQ